MRPRSIEEFIGQQEIVGDGRLLRRAIVADMISSVIFYGPPGTGKTTLARIIANTTNKNFRALNAVLSGVADVRKIIAEVRGEREKSGVGTILFVDEVHRWNKGQQDALLPWVENGTVIFIGATTHNPFFEVNRALVSRSRIFQLQSLSGAALRGILDAALNDAERGYGGGAPGVEVTGEAGAHLCEVANGDARVLLNALELAVESSLADRGAGGAGGSDAGPVVIDLAVAEESIQRKAVLYDRDGDYHFDTISAFIKSIRGSDADAALYWMARMVGAGEDPRYILRRMVILAAEDVGLADPQALVVVTSAAAGFERIGMPEGQYLLSEAALYLALAPKSNSTIAYYDALRAVERERDAEPPAHLRDSARDGEGFGHGKGYLYPHAYTDHWVAQSYLPGSLRGRLFYQPNGLGFEGERKAEYLRRRQEQLAMETDGALGGAGGGGDGEVLSWSPPNRGEKRRLEQWKQRLAGSGDAGERFERLRGVYKQVLEQWGLGRSGRLVIGGRGAAALLWEAARALPEGGVSVLLVDQQEYDVLSYHAGVLTELMRPELHHCAAPGGLAECLLRARGEGAGGSGESGAEDCDGVALLGVIGDYRGRGGADGAEDGAVLQDGGFGDVVRAGAGRVISGGRVLAADRLPFHGVRLSGIAGEGGMDDEYVKMLEDCEQHLYGDGAPGYYRVDGGAVAGVLEQVGLGDVTEAQEEIPAVRALTGEIIESWVAGQKPKRSGGGARPHTYARYLAENYDAPAIARLRGALVQALAVESRGAEIVWPLRYTVVTGRKK